MAIGHQSDSKISRTPRSHRRVYPLYQRREFDNEKPNVVTEATPLICAGLLEYERFSNGIPDRIVKYHGQQIPSRKKSLIILPLTNWIRVPGTVENTVAEVEIHPKHTGWDDSQLLCEELKERNHSLHLEYAEKPHSLLDEKHSPFFAASCQLSLGKDYSSRIFELQVNRFVSKSIENSLLLCDALDTVFFGPIARTYK